MFRIMLWFSLAIGLTLFVVRLTAQWPMHWSGQMLQSKFQAADTITNEERVPKEWLRSFRRRADRIRRMGGGAERLQRMAERTRKRCLRKLDSLLRFFEHSAFVDSPSTRHQRSPSWAVRSNRPAG